MVIAGSALISRQIPAILPNSGNKTFTMRTIHAFALLLFCALLSACDPARRTTATSDDDGVI